MASGDKEAFDFIIVGAGSAGCVLADRLSADGGNRVLVLEFGGSDRSVLIQMPAALSIPMNMAKYNWRYETEPEPHLGGRRLHCPRGKVIGGSSSINGLVYVRGNPLDFERWEEEGAAGWGYRHVLPYFQRAESRQEGGDAWRGGSGPLSTRYGRIENPLYKAFVEAAKQAGYPATDDINGEQQEGFGRMDMTVRDGVRWSAANAYLKPAMRRANLEVRTHALVTRILFEGTRAVGVRYAQGGLEHDVMADREVILSGGPINSPHLLKLSGVGPADELQGLGIDVVRDLPGVGENLQDHLEFYFQVACREPVTLLHAMRPHNMVRIGLRWFLFHDGPAASSHLEAGGFIRSAPGVRHPDIQFHFLPALVEDHGRSKGRAHAYQAHAGTMRPLSRGWLELRSADPRRHPLIEPNYLAEERDRADLRACVRLTRELFAQPAFDRYRGQELRPGAEVESDAAIDAFVRARADSAYHPCCTCRMGADPLAVVDPGCRVRGLDGLRVVDASVMPSMVSGNLNAPTIMLAEKAADLIRGRPPLAPAEAAVWEAPDWRTRQRTGPASPELARGRDGVNLAKEAEMA